MEKLFWYATLIITGVAALKVFVFWIIQKILHPEVKKQRRSSLVEAETNKVSSLFNQLLKSRQLTREDILIVRNILKKYACKKYTNDAHLIYSVLKHGNVRRQDLGTIEVFLESKIKC